MANLQVKGIDDEFYGELKRLAEAENRSLSQQVMVILREYLLNPLRILSLISWGARQILTSNYAVKAGDMSIGTRCPQIDESLGPSMEAH